MRYLHKHGKDLNPSSPQSSPPLEERRKPPSPLWGEGWDEGL